MKRLVVARRAASDLDQIWVRFAQEAGIEIADAYLDSLEVRFRALANMPGIGRLRDDFGAGTMSFPAEGYMIYYTRRARGGVRISRVIHGSRDQRAAFHEPE